MSGPSAISSASPCWSTRPRPRARWWPRSSPARSAASSRPRFPPSASPSRRSSRPACCRPKPPRHGEESSPAVFPFLANGRALSMDAGEGFVRVIARKDDHRILGIQAVGAHVSELSNEFATRWKWARCWKTSPAPSTPIRHWARPSTRLPCAPSATPSISSKEERRRDSPQRRSVVSEAVAYSRSMIVTLASAAAFAHGLQPVALVPVLERIDQRRHQLGARAAQRMAQRDGAAIDVQPRRIGAGRLQPGQRHRGEGLVDFEQVDVVDLHAGALQRLLGRRQRRFQHDHRIAADHGHVDDARQRLHAQRLEPVLVDDHHARGAVADLAGGRRRQLAAFGIDQLHALHAFQRHIEADAFVDGVHLRLAVGGGDFQRQDLVLEGAGLGRGDGLLLAVIAELVELVLRQVVFLGHHLGAHELAELDAGITLFLVRALGAAEAVLGRQHHRQAHRHAAHAFHAGGDHAIHRPAHHGLRREVQRLLRGAALPVHAGAPARFRAAWTTAPRCARC